MLQSATEYGIFICVTCLLESYRPIYDHIGLQYWNFQWIFHQKKCIASFR